MKGMYVCFEISLKPKYLPPHQKKNKTNTYFAVSNSSNENFESIKQIISCRQFS